MHLSPPSLAWWDYCNCLIFSLFFPLPCSLCLELLSRQLPGPTQASSLFKRPLRKAYPDHPVKLQPLCPLLPPLPSVFPYPVLIFLFFYRIYHLIHTVTYWLIRFAHCLSPPAPPRRWAPWGKGWLFLFTRVSQRAWKSAGTHSHWRLFSGEGETAPGGTVLLQGCCLQILNDQWLFQQLIEPWPVQTPMDCVIGYPYIDTEGWGHDVTVPV